MTTVAAFSLRLASGRNLVEAADLKNKKLHRNEGWVKIHLTIREADFRRKTLKKAICDLLRRVMPEKKTSNSNRAPFNSSEPVLAKYLLVPKFQTKTPLKKKLRIPFLPLQFLRY